MLANWITLSRFPLLAGALAALAWGTPALRVVGVATLLVGFLLDTLDGVVARRRGEAGLFGSVLDIAADRVYELVLWIFFAGAGLVPVAIPIIVVARTTVTDAFRSIGVGEGTSPFAQHQTRVGRFLVASTWMRTGYSVTKVAAFVGLALAYAWRVRVGEGSGLPASRAMGLLPILTWVVVALCVLRGLPVIIHALRHHWPARGPVVAGG
jgi:phosphatidylglycerophosphate synthase